MTRPRTASPRHAALFVIAAGLAAGCSSTSSQRTASDDQELPLEFAKLVAATPQAEDGGEFFDPFTIGAAADPQREETRPPDTGPRTNPGLVSVYGDLSTAPHQGKGRRRQFADENVAQVSFSTEGADFDPDISGDGSFAVFASTQHTTAADIYLKNIDSRTVTQLTSDPANDLMPSISPDGKRIVFASDRSGNWDIYVMNASGGQAVQITSDTTDELHPTWSPDGAHLCFCRLGDVSGKWELWVVEAANPAVRRFIGYGLFPEWSPVGDKILFQRSRERGDRFFSVWTIDYVNGEGINPTEIISSPVAAVVNPCWSPDGNRIAFAVIPNPDHKYGQRPRKADLWICNLDGAARANLTGGRFVNLSPVWAKDQRIYFISDRSGTDNLWSLAPEQAITAASAPRAQDGMANAPEGD